MPRQLRSVSSSAFHGRRDTETAGCHLTGSGSSWGLVLLVCILKMKGQPYLQGTGKSHQGPCCCNHWLKAPCGHPEGAKVHEWKLSSSQMQNGSFASETGKQYGHMTQTYQTYWTEWHDHKYQRPRRWNQEVEGRAVGRKVSHEGKVEAIPEQLG